MSKINRCIICIFIGILFLGASKGTLAHAYMLLADTRNDLEERGVTWEAVYTGEFWANTKGGLKRDETYLGNFDFTITIDTEQVGLWKNGMFFIYFLDNHGGKKLTGEIVGDTQTISNIEAPRASRLYEIWYEHLFLEERLSVLFGIHDYNSEFAVTEYGGLYINSSFGIAPDISSSARPSIFPLAAPALRLKWAPNDKIEWLVAVYDGDPGDPETDKHYPRSTFDSNQGTFIASEWIYHTVIDKDVSELPGAYKFGLWYNTGDFNDVVDTTALGDPIVRKGNMGGYIIIDQMLYREQDAQGLGAFLQIGGNSVRINEVDFYLGGGLNYLGLIPARDEDEFGIAVGYASTSDDIVDAKGRDDAETTLELTYRIQVNENIAIQPDVQFVFNPGADPSLKDALIAGVRFELSL